jgi:hypothetical protein
MEMYTATFGNMNFAIQPSMTGEVSNTFGIVPYVSVESVIYAQANAQVDPGRLVVWPKLGPAKHSGPVHHSR